MKRFVLITSFVLIGLAAPATTFGQKGCEFKIVGTWRAEKADQINQPLYRFASDATLTVLMPSGSGASLKEIARAVYTLDAAKTPKVILVKASKAAGDFAEGTTALEIIAHNDAFLTLVKPGAPPMRWVRVEPHRYFMVLVGRMGTFYDDSGPTFPMMIKMNRQETQIDAAGIYDQGGKWAFGTIPADTIKQFMKESPKATEVMLRLEITGAQYERGLKIVQTWERRARDGELLYPDLYMDNILLVKQVTESLNQCGETIKLYSLDWSLNDHISSSSKRDDNPFTRIPFLYFKELRRLNEALHIPDAKFYETERGLRRQAR